MMNPKPIHAQLQLLRDAADEWITYKPLGEAVTAAFTAAANVAKWERGDEDFGRNATTFHAKREIVRNLPHAPEEEKKRALGLLHIAGDLAVKKQEVDVGAAINDVAEGIGYQSWSKW